MFRKFIYILYIVFESGESSIAHTFDDLEQALEMKERMCKHSEKHKLNERFFIIGYERIGMN